MRVSMATSQLGWDGQEFLKVRPVAANLIQKLRGVLLVTAFLKRFWTCLDTAVRAPKLLVVAPFARPVSFWAHTISAIRANLPVPGSPE